MIGNKKNFVRILLFFFLFFVVSSNYWMQQLFAASFEFNPPVTTAKVNCPFEINLDIDPKGASVNAADIRIDFNPSEIVILDYNTNTPSLDLKPGDAFENFYALTVDSSVGRIVFAGDNANQALTTRKTFATITIKSQPNVTQSSLTIFFSGVGATLDSNIASATNSSDLLTSVLNAQINFSNQDKCNVSDSNGPQIFLISPSSNQNVDIDAPIVINLVDDISGINLDTLVITINGINFTANSPWIKIAGTPNNYVITITLPPGLKSPRKNINLEISAADKEGNKSAKNFSFSIASAITATEENFNLELAFEFVPFVAPLSGLLALLLLLLTGTNLTGLAAKIFALLIGRRERPWGVVMDINTGNPISLATCRLFYQNSTEIIASAISNLDGTYGFALKSGGEYRVEVTKEGYQPFSSSLSIPDDISGYVYDVYMSPIDSIYMSRISFRDNISLRITKFFKSLGSFFFIIGFIFSIFAVLISPILWNFVILGLYLLVSLVSLWLFFYGRNRLSVVVDSITGRPIPYAIIKLYNIKERKNLDTIVAGRDGTFDYFGEPGTYGVIVLRKGYTFPSTRQNDLELLEEMYFGMAKLYLKKGRNKYKILMDPAEGNQISEDYSSMSNPFS